MAGCAVLLLPQTGLMRAVAPAFCFVPVTTLGWPTGVSLQAQHTEAK